MESLGDFERREEAKRESTRKSDEKETFTTRKEGEKDKR